jgi:prophage regulatory protein
MDNSPAKLMLDEYKQLMKLYVLQSRLLRVDEREAHEAETGERILRLREVVHRCGISKRTIYRLEAVGRFPARRRLGPRAVGWAESEVRAWIANPAG